MISDKFIKDYHLKEVTWYFGSRENTFNAIILADKQKGVSIKPYWDEEEKQCFIELSIANGWPLDRILSDIASPTFCFAYIHKECKVDDARKAIANGNLDVLKKFGNKPICPFA